MPDFRVGPEVPCSIVLQTDDWSCAVRASYAAVWIRATLEGKIPPTYAAWSSLVVPKYDNADVGLTDGSGNGLEELFRILGVPAFNIHPARLENVQRFVREGNVVMIGGHQWGPFGHWALAVGLEDDGTLILENPAGCYNLGGTNICDRLLTSWSKSQWSAVVIPTALSNAGQPPVDNSAARIKELEKQLADCRNLVGNAYNPDGEVRKSLRAIDSWLEANRA